MPLFLPQLMNRRRNNNQLFKNLTEEKNVEIHKHSYLSIIWIFKKLNSLKSNYLTNYPANICLDEDVLKTSWRRLSSSSSEDILKTSSRRLDQDKYVHLSLTSSEYVFKTSWSRPIYSSWPYVMKTSSRHFQDVLPRCFQDVFKTSCKNFCKTSSRRLQEVLEMSSRPLAKISSRLFQDVSSS